MLFYASGSILTKDKSQAKQQVNFDEKYVVGISMVIKTETGW